MWTTVVVQLIPTVLATSEALTRRRATVAPNRNCYVQLVCQIPSTPVIERSRIAATCQLTSATPSLWALTTETQRWRSVARSPVPRTTFSTRENVIKWRASGRVVRSTNNVMSKERCANQVCMHACVNNLSRCKLDHVIAKPWVFQAFVDVQREKRSTSTNSFTSSSAVVRGICLLIVDDVSKGSFMQMWWF